MIRLKRFAVFGAALAVAAAPGSADAQFSPGPRSVGMGGAGMVFARGVDAIEWNPANLALAGGWSLSAEAGASGLMTGASFQQMQDIADSGGLTPAEVDQLIADLPVDGLTLSSAIDGYAADRARQQYGDVPDFGQPLPTIGLTLGSFGIRARSRVLSEVRVSRELVDLALKDFDPARLSEYQVGNTGFRSASFTEITAAYSASLGGRLALGVGARYVMGHQLAEGRFFEPTIDLTNETIEVNAIGVEATGGTGYGLDVGAALQLPLGFRLSAAGQNVVQQMTWDDNLTVHEGTFFGCDEVSNPTGCPAGTSDFNGDLSFEDVKNKFAEYPIDPSSVTLPVARTAQDLFRGAYFPTVFRGGIGWHAGWTTLELVGTTVSPRGRMSNDWDQRISLGIEQRLLIFVFRAGAAKGDNGLQMVSGGLGLWLGPLHVDIGGGLMAANLSELSNVTSGVVTSSDGPNYAGGHVSVAVEITGGGR